MNILNKKSDDLLYYLLEHGDVSLYGCKIKDFPDVLLKNNLGRVSAFIKNKKENTLLPGYFPFENYNDLLDIHKSEAEICFLDKEAIRSLFIRLPIRPKYVLVRFIPRLTWILGLLGLLRRVIKGQLTICGVRKFSANGKLRMWLVLKLATSRLRSSFTLSDKVGIQGLLDFLREERIEYVILRFFEKLPNLYREGGDLDILISDEGYKKLGNFLETRRGSIALDIWSISALQHIDMPYYPPPIAHKILASAIDGPAGSNIPAPKELFLSFAYHVLYHSGEGAGVPSTTPEVKINPNPDNAYTNILKKMAKNAGIVVDMNMESLDEYLANEGWRPRIDSLAKIAGSNKGVRQRCFSKNNVKEIGLSVLIIREKAVRLNLSNKILAGIKKEKFKVLRYKFFNNKEKKWVASSLRGGNWTDGKGLEQKELFTPRMAIVVLDLHFLYNKSKDVYSDRNRSRFLKKKIRSKIDQGKISLVHSTDNTNEAWEYIKVCFPNEVESIKRDVYTLCENFQPAFLERANLRLRGIFYYKAILISKLRERIIKLFIK